MALRQVIGLLDVAARYRRVTLAACLLLVALAGHFLHQEAWLRPHDDALYMTASAAQYLAPERYETLSQRVEEALKATDSPALDRYLARDRFITNYAATRLLLAGGYQVTDFREAGSSAFANITAVLMSAVPLLLTALATALLVGVASREATGRWLAALVIVGTYMALETLFDVGQTTRVFANLAEGEPFSILQTLETIGRLILDGTASTQLWGANARHVWMILFLALFLMRWRGWTMAAYALLLPMSQVHQSQTLLFLPWLLAIDLLAQPHLFRRGAFLAMLGVVAVVLVASESGWVFVGITKIIVAVVLVAGAAALALVAWRYPQVLPPALRGAAAGMGRLYSKATALAQRPGPVARDVSLMALLWGAFMVVTGLGNIVATAEQSALFWGHIGGRTLGLIRPVLLTGLCIIALEAVGARIGWTQMRQRAAMATAVATSAAVLVGVLAVAWPGSIIARNTALLQEIEAALDNPVQQIRVEHEKLVYYALTKGALLDAETLGFLVLQRAPEPAAVNGEAAPASESGGPGAGGS